MSEPPRATTSIAARSSAGSATRSLSRYARPSAPCSSSAEAVARVGVLAQHDDADVGVRAPQAVRDADALVVARGRHAHVGHHDVGVLAVDDVEQLVAVVADRDDLDLREPGEDLAHRLAHQERVVGNRDTDAA